MTAQPDPDIGSLHHFAHHRSEYLTRAQAVTRIRKSRRTIERYVAQGLHSYRIAEVEYVHIDELLAMLRSKLTRQRQTRAQ